MHAVLSGPLGPATCPLNLVSNYSDYIFDSKRLLTPSLRFLLVGKHFSEVQRSQDVVRRRSLSSYRRVQIRPIHASFSRQLGLTTGLPNFVLKNADHVFNSK